MSKLSDRCFTSTRAVLARTKFVTFYLSYLSSQNALVLGYMDGVTGEPEGCGLNYRLVKPSMKSQHLNPSLSLQSPPKPRQQPLGPFTFPHAPRWNTKPVQKSAKETIGNIQSNQKLTSSRPLRIDQGVADLALPEVLRSSSHEHPTLPKST